MLRLASLLPLILSATCTIACSDSGSDDGGEETGGTGGTATGGTSTGGSATGGSSGSTTGGTSTGGSSTGGSTTGGSSTGGSGGSGTGGSAPGGSGGAGGGGFTKRGVCGQKGAATVTETTYEDGVEEFYMVSQENVEEGLLDQYICHIRYDVTRVGPVASTTNCVDPMMKPCLWTHKVRISNPTVVTNENGACEANEFRWDAAWRAQQDGTEPEYGYIFMYEGHDSVIMKASGTAWSVFGRASWDDMNTGEFSYDNRIGNCRY